MKKIAFLCWDEEVKRSLNAVAGYLCIEGVCFSENQRFFEFIEGNENVIAFIDILLPKENGYIVCKKTKEIKESVKTVLLTARGLNKEEIKRRWNADYILEKPIRWQEMGEILKEEGIEFPPPFDEGEGEPQEFLQVLLDALLTGRRMLIVIEDGDEVVSVKVSDGWADLDGVRNLMDTFEKEKIFFKTEPLKEEIQTEGLVHLSQVIRGIIRVSVRDEGMIGKKFSIVEGVEVPWFLTPYEREFLRKLKGTSFRRIEFDDRKLAEMLYFLSIMNLIKMEFTQEKSTPHSVEDKEPPHS